MSLCCMDAAVVPNNFLFGKKAKNDHYKSISIMTYFFIFLFMLLYFLFFRIRDFDLLS